MGPQENRKHRSDQRSRPFDWRVHSEDKILIPSSLEPRVLWLFKEQKGRDKSQLRIKILPSIDFLSNKRNKQNDKRKDRESDIRNELKDERKR